MDAIKNLRSYDNSYFLTVKPPTKSPHLQLRVGNNMGGELLVWVPLASSSRARASIASTHALRLRLADRHCHGECERTWLALLFTSAPDTSRANLPHGSAAIP